MPLPVSVREIVEEIQLLMDVDCVYVNRHTGEVLRVMDESGGLFGDDVDDDLHADPPKPAESKDWVAMPTKSDVHEWRIMERFSHSVEDEAASRTLLSAIRGRGAFRRFDDALIELGLRQDWFRYRDRSIAVQVEGVLEIEGIPFVRDLREE